MKLTFTGVMGIFSVIVLAIAGYLLLRKGGLIDSAGKLVTEKLNPASDKNIVYQGTNKALAAITGNETDTLGTAAYGWFHNSDGSFKWPWQDNKESSPFQRWTRYNATTPIDFSKIGSSGMPEKIEQQYGVNQSYVGAPIESGLTPAAESKFGIINY